MFYKDAVEWIKNIERVGSDFGLERERELLDLLGSPDKDLKIVHVAGTNGKGSVTAYLTAICVSACLKVGTYNSPSVFEYAERFLLNGAPIGGGFIASAFERIKNVIAKRRTETDGEGFTPTAFEIETAAALLTFKEMECDVVILETGLGGRWDATNAVSNKLLSIITPISLDHCAILGDTIAQIAEEKADIIKGDVITCAQPVEAFEVIERVAKERGSLLVASTPQVVACDIEGQAFEYKGKNFFVGLLGAHQPQNASLAIEGARYLSKHGFAITEEHIRYGLAVAEWHARFEIIGQHNNRFNLLIPNGKLLVLDGGHNPQGAEVLAESLRTYFAGLRIHLVVGVLADKDYKEMVKILAPIANRVSTVTPPSPRALSAAELALEFEKCGVTATPYEIIPLAVEQALGDYYGDVIVLCGSLTLFESLGKKS